MIHPRSLPVPRDRDEVTSWWCSDCQTRVAGPWHAEECPHRCPDEIEDPA